MSMVYYKQTVQVFLFRTITPYSGSKFSFYQDPSVKQNYEMTEDLRKISFEPEFPDVFDHSGSLDSGIVELCVVCGDRALGDTNHRVCVSEYQLSPQVVTMVP